MFKLLPPTFFVVPAAWLTIMLLAGLNAITPALRGVGITPSVSWVVLSVQGVITLFFVTPLWRTGWRLLPQLNDWFYPDLNGLWKVHVLTNWPRIDATLKAANAETPPLDVRHLPDAELPPLGHSIMHAEITQSWLRMEIVLWNPKGDSPIQESRTLIVEPFRRKNRRHGVAYVFEQENAAQVVSDDRSFRASAWLERDRADTHTLCGRMWSDRMWRRGMNTAADLRFERQSSVKPARRRAKTRQG